MGFPPQIQNAQDNAKSSKKRIWKDYVPEAAVEEVEEQQKKEMDSERKVGYFLRVEVLSTMFGMLQQYLNALVNFTSFKRPGCSD